MYQTLPAVRYLYIKFIDGLFASDVNYSINTPIS